MAEIRKVKVLTNPRTVRLGGVAGATSLLSLTDAPATYAGQSGKFAAVKSTEDGIEFSSAGAGDMLAAQNLADVASQQTALDNVTNVSAATDEHVLTKDTATGNAIFKAAAGGGGGISNVVEDTTPQLGGALDVNAKEITGAIDLHSTGDVINELGDAAGVNKLIVKDSAAVEVAAIDSDGNITTSGTVDGIDVATDVAANTAKATCDTANVTAAGALMDSEVVNLAQVKAFDTTDYATAAQGAAADAAVQPSTAPVLTGTNFTGIPNGALSTDPLARANHTGTQTLSTISDAGTAAASATGDFATAAQGTTADAAVQPSTAPILTGTNFTGIPNGALSTNPLARANHTGTQLLSTISDAGTAAASATGDFATAAQGTTADAALPKAGGTMTGKLQFSGTTFASIQLISLTTTERNALSPPADEGDVIYNETDAQIQGFMGAAWVNLGAGAGGGDPDQNLWSAIAGDGGTNPVPDGITDTLTIAGGTGVDTAGDSTTDTLTVNLNAASIASLAAADTAVQPLTAPTLTGTNFTGIPTGGIATTLTGKTLTTATIDSDNNTITNIVNADIKAAAAIAVNKLAALTASRAMVTDGSGFASAATVTATELGLLAGKTALASTRTGVKRTQWVGSGAMTPNATGGAVPATIELTNNSYDVLDFTPAGNLAASFVEAMPEVWDTAVLVKMRFYWLTVATTGNAQWAVTTNSFADDDVLSTAPAGEQTVTDAAKGTASDLAVTAITGTDITIQGTPSVGHLVQFEISLKSTATTIASNGRLLGVQFQFEELDAEPSAIT